MNNKINILISLFLKQKPYISIIILTVFVSLFSFFLAISILYIIDFYFFSFNIDTFYYKLTAFCSIFDAMVITPLLSYHLLHTIYERNNLLDKLDYTSKYDGLIQKVDKALYLAKNNGRNSVEQVID